MLIIQPFNIIRTGKMNKVKLLSKKKKLPYYVKLLLEGM